MLVLNAHTIAFLLQSHRPAVLLPGQPGALHQTESRAILEHFHATLIEIEQQADTVVFLSALPSLPVAVPRTACAVPNVVHAVAL